MEIMALSREGQVFITSTGFEPDRQQPMPDYELALSSPDGSGKWVGELNTGEKVMAITRTVRDENGVLMGSIRYMVSMELADQQKMPGRLPREILRCVLKRPGMTRLASCATPLTIWPENWARPSA